MDSVSIIPVSSTMVIASMVHDLESILASIASRTCALRSAFETFSSLEYCAKVMSASFPNDNHTTSRDYFTFKLSG